jgi:hypothetical protein
VICHGIATSHLGSSVSMYISGAVIRVNVHLELNGRSFAPNTDLRSLRIIISWLVGWTSRSRSSETPSASHRRPPDSWISGRKYLWRDLIASARNEETVSHILHRNCCNKSCSVCSNCCYYVSFRDNFFEYRWCFCSVRVHTAAVLILIMKGNLKKITTLECPSVEWCS